MASLHFNLISKFYLKGLLLASMVLIVAGCGSGSRVSTPQDLLQVNASQDTAAPSAGTVTLRSAIENAAPNETITFAPSMDGDVIALTVVGDAHTMLPAEVYAGGPPTFQGYSDRDHGASAIFIKKSLTIDASSLPNGVTIRWSSVGEPARVLAVFGNLTLQNVRITGGHSEAVAIDSTSQPYTLARGGGIAVWGTLTLDNCAIYGNSITGDLTASRDRGAYGGGIYANGLNVKNSIISGNTAAGYGAAGGGIYSVGGADKTNGLGNDTVIAQSSITGNRVTAQHSYGAGIFTLSGGPRNLATMRITNSTIARNLVEDNATLPESGQYYYRGGGIYMGGGSLSVTSSTIVENEVRGARATFSGKPNVGGGGIAATIGDAHVVEDLTLQSSIFAGNRLNGELQDVFAGSLLNFYSNGYNLVGIYDFSQILVPVPDWMNLSRKHYPKTGDAYGVLLSNVLALDQTAYAPYTSEGTDAGEMSVVISYAPAGAALDRVPASGYNITNVSAGYTGFGVPTDDFLNHVVQKVGADYSQQLGPEFATQFGDMTGVTWYGPAISWPSNAQNAAWITFWHNLDTAINGRLGTVTLGDDFWGSYTSGPLCPAVSITVNRTSKTVTPVTIDQRNQARPRGSMGDVGAVER